MYPLIIYVNYVLFLFFRKSKTTLMSGAEVEPSIPPPPSLPPNQKAPWINIESSVLSADWSKLVNHEQFSDVYIHVGLKQFYAHKYVLCSSSGLMRQLFGIQGVGKVESLSECPLWSAKRVKHFSIDRVNEGKEEGFLSVVMDNQ